MCECVRLCVRACVYVRVCVCTCVYVCTSVCVCSDRKRLRRRMTDSIILTETQTKIETEKVGREGQSIERWFTLKSHGHR